MKDKSKVYLNLAKCSEEQLKQIPNILEDAGEKISNKRILSAFNIGSNSILAFKNDAWYMFAIVCPKRTELTFEEFLDLLKGQNTTKQQLIKEAKDRNITELCFIDRQSMEAITDATIIPKGESWEYDCVHDVLYLNEKQVYEKGKWAKVVDTKDYFIFPKAEEGDFPDLTGFEGQYMRVYDNSLCEKKARVIAKYSDDEFKFHFISDLIEHWRFAEPIEQQEITISELFQKAGLEQEKFKVIEK